MTFELLRAISDTSTWIIKANREDGSQERMEINTNFTVHAHEKLARYDRAEVLQIRPVVTSWDFGMLNTLEVELRV